MSKLKNRYWLKTDDFSDGTGKATEKPNKGLQPAVFP